MLVGDFSIVAEAPAPDYHVVKSGAVCTENLIRVDDVMESPKLAE
jgi:hypothetical protein